MVLSPPTGSKITIDRESAHPVLLIPHQPSGFILKYGIALFLCVWLGGWFFGFVSAGNEVLSGFVSGHVEGFLLFWLAGWTVGGIFALYFLYRIFRPSVRARLTMMPDSVVYDSGIPPFTMQLNYMNQKEVWKQMFPKRKRFEFTRDDLKSLSLRETPDSNRLTIDKGVERVEIAARASDIEREWLHEQLKGRYL